MRLKPKPTDATEPDVRTDRERPAEGLKALNLVAKGDARFYKQQIATMERQGVECTTLVVPGEHKAGETVESRSVTDYLKFYPQVLAHSFGDYDLIHANYGLTAPIALAQPNLPVVLSLWGTDLYGKYGAVSRWCARRSDAVIVMSEDMREDLGQDCHVIPHGIDMERFAPAPQADAQAEVGWDPDKRHVLFPYPTSRDVKNFPLAERVVERASTEFAEGVELHSVYGVPHEGVSTYMNAADALLLTSKREGSPNSVKEALACDLPVVATDVGDVSDRLAGVHPSAVGQTEDELVDGLVSVLRAGKPSNGRESVRELGLDRMGERIAAIYADVAGRSAPLVSVSVSR